MSKKSKKKPQSTNFDYPIFPETSEDEFIIGTASTGDMTGMIPTALNETQIDDYQDIYEFLPRTKD
ncbi:MAG: hypothetical protein LBL93_07470 [Ruminococcus sp.]|jgi:hypothetical protein|nr:hypothetical protein [Ruminococcus sp.]